jgi:hypothetical protein
MIKTSLAVAAFLTQVLPAMAYPLVDAACKDNIAACIKAGKLEYVSIYGKLGYEDLDFFTMLDETLPKDAVFPRVFLNSYGGKAFAGIGIGRILRKHHATAESGSPVIPDATPQCTSACVFVAQGAYHRRLTHVGLHSSSVRVQIAPNVWETQPGEMGKIKRYMTEMGAAYATNLLMERTSFHEVTDFFYDPKLPVEGQPIYKLRFYDRYDQYFTASQFTYPDDFSFKTHEDYMINAANYGSFQAMRDLADYYVTYLPDGEPDFVSANRWLKMAADKGDVMSMHSLGYHYAYGLGVAQDKAKAAELYLQAAKLGFAGSQNNIGWDYFTGEGVPKSLADAVYWITKSAEQGEPFAYGSLCEISDATDLFKSDPVEAFMWCGLAVYYLDDGAAKDASQVVYDRIMKTITPANYATGSVQIQKWKAEVETFSTMRNVGDDLN